MAERNEKKGKKKYAEPEMGYCPLSIRQPGAGLGSQVGARDALRWARETHAAGGRGAAWACCWASGLCTLCTQPVFGPV